MELLVIYFLQITSFDSLSFNAPSLYAWLPGERYTQLVDWMVLLAAFVLTALSLFVWKKNIKIGKDQILALAFLSVLITPFLLPKMHERYFYSADAFSILFGIFFPQYFLIPIIMVSVSFFSYFQYLFVTQMIPIPHLAFWLFVMIGVLLYNWKDILTNKK